MMPASIEIGTSGWNYPAGRGTWNGIFYPTRRGRGFNELTYYAEHFDTVEVNSTFYRMPDPGLTLGWIARTPPAFQFSVKLFQKFTHPDLYLARNGVSDWNLSIGDFDEFRRGIDPLAGAGRLAALLIQFPPSFHADPDTRGYLEWLLDALASYPLAVELRHRTWSDEADATDRLLSARGATWVVIDEPKFKDSVRQGLTPADGDRAAAGLPPLYFRFHGRNAGTWWDHDEAEDRYDYLYSRAELAPFARAAERASSSGRRVLMYLNNHFSAKSVANAAVLRDEIGQKLPGEYPREMIDRYPELEGIVATSGLPL
jgi:uncharacterized protein YecE (DUF72 family)